MSIVTEGKQTRIQTAVENPENLTFTETKGNVLCYVTTVKEKIDTESNSGEVMFLWLWL